MNDAVSPRVRLDPTLTVGALLQIGTLILGFTSYLVLGNAAATQTQRDVAALQTAMAQQATTNRAELERSLSRIETGMGQLQSQISNLPDLTARTRQLEVDMRRGEARATESDNRFEGRRIYVDTRLDELRRATIEATAQLDGLRRATGLPETRGPR